MKSLSKALGHKKPLPNSGKMETLRHSNRPLRPGRVLCNHKHQRVLRKLSLQLQTFLEERKITKIDLARSMKVSPSYISHLLVREATAEQIERVAKALHISPYEFDEYHVRTFKQRLEQDDPIALQAAFQLIDLQKGDK